MGAWGHGSFENDSALDWLAETEEDPSLVKETLDAVFHSDPDAYLEVDECSAALAAAELVAAGIGRGTDRLSPDAKALLQKWTGGEPLELAEPLLALGAVERVFANAEKSELRGLWDDSEPDGAWHAGVRELMRRLKE